MVFFHKRLTNSSGPLIHHLPRGGRPSKKRLLWRGLLLLGFSCFVLAASVFTLAAAWVSRSLPDPNTLTTREVAQSTKIFDRTGTHLLYEIHGDEQRTLVKLGDISPYVKNATIAIEDKRFYDHRGIDLKGLLRAVYTYATQRKVQGASTLTQQLVKNALLTRQRTFSRKLKEFVLALQLERTFSKDDILQMYLNEIPYGSTLYGIESASQTYFGKPSKDLTLDEAALLAAIPQAPDYYSPYGLGSRGDNRSRLIKRQQYIMDVMAEQGYITADQAAEAKNVDTLRKLKSKLLGNISAPHFVMYVRSQLVEKYGQKMVEQGGLRVTTTLDWDKQQAAEKEINNGVDARGKKYGFTNGALISLDPQTGQVLAMVGSKDFFDEKNDGQVNVTLRPRQPGSSFKPIVYATGFIQGYTPDTLLWDVQTVFKTDIGPYEPHDYDGKERGPLTVRQALQGSLNIPAVQMLYLVGLPRVLDFAYALGYTTLEDRSRFGLSLVLGGGEVKPIEHAAAFGAFASEGILYPTGSILKVEDNQGATLEEWKQPAGRRVMEPQISRLISNILSDNDARAYIFGLKNFLTLPDRPVAVKTGTTNNNRDAWTVGYTPNLVTAVWVGNNDGSEMKTGADGSIVAAPIWNTYMRQATKALPIMSFNAPDQITVEKPILRGTLPGEVVRIDRVSQKRATDLTPPDLVEEINFRAAHSILYYVDKDDPAGPVPTNPATDPQFENWEAGVHSWVERQATSTYRLPPSEFDDVHVAQNIPQITILQPSAGQTITSHSLIVDAAVQAQRPIVSVEFRVDGMSLGSRSSLPWNQYLTLPDSLINGEHDLQVIAHDNAGNQSLASLHFTLDAPATEPSSSWNPPSATGSPLLETSGSDLPYP